MIPTENALKPLPVLADTPAKRFRWWASLTPAWRAAFSMAFWGQTAEPTNDDLVRLWQTPVLRFAGPKAPYPNMSFELTDCSGLAGMSNLEILVLTNHRLESLAEVATMPDLKSLFVNNNQLTSLTGVESLNRLEQLYAQVNRIGTLAPVQNLTALAELFVNYNALTTLDGITKAHSNRLKKFVCLPNDDLPDREIIRVEQRLGIRCQRG